MTEIPYTTRLNEEEKAEVAEEVRQDLEKKKKDEALDALLDKGDIGGDPLLDEVRAETAIEGDIDDEGYESEEERAKASAQVVTPEPSSISSFDEVPASGASSLTPDSLDSPPLDPIDEVSEDEGIDVKEFSPEGSVEKVNISEELETDSDPQDSFIDDLLFGEAGFSGKQPANSEEAEEIRQKWKAKGARLELRAEAGKAGSVDSDPELDDAFAGGEADIVHDTPVDDLSPLVSPIATRVPSDQSSIEHDPFLPQDTDRKVQVFGKRILGRFFPDEETGEDVAARPADDLIQAAVLAVQDPQAREDLISVQSEIDRLKRGGQELSANGQYLLELVGAAVDIAKTEGPFNPDDISLRIQKGINHSSYSGYADPPVQSSA